MELVQINPSFQKSKRIYIINEVNQRYSQSIIIIFPQEIKQLDKLTLFFKLTMKQSNGEVFSIFAGFPVTYSTLHKNYDCWIWRLDNSHSAWSSMVNDKDQWVQVSSIKPEKWIGVITQGRPNWDQRVQEFQVTYTIDGLTWSYVDQGRHFPANKDRHTKIRNNFLKAVTARAIRIHPTKWQSHISMRFDAIFIET